MITTEVFMDIIALRRQGFTMRYIARKLGIHRNTVKKYLEDKKPPHYHKSKRNGSILDPYKQTIDDYLKDDDYRATWLFDRICKMGYAGSYDTVKNYVRQVKERLTRLAFTRFETEPGLQAQVDWGDFQVREPNGLITTIYAFVMVLGFCRAMFVDFVKSCTLETFMDCHIHAFRYLKGMPAEILYDNMKNVVISKKHGTVNFNIEFIHFAGHYQFVPKPCPPYSPWVKGKVERPMDYVRERFWRGYCYGSIEEANRDVLTWLNEVANQRIHGTHRQPVALRWLQEIEHLGKLPAADYDTSVKVFRKVYKDCQVSYNCNRYVLPHHVVGKKVMLKIKNATLRFYDDDQLLATYSEPEGKHHLVANPVFYQRLKKDKEQQRRKYGRSKGKATRGLINASLFPQVAHRPLAEYERFAQGGVTWNS
jgi:transposase